VLTCGLIAAGFHFCSVFIYAHANNSAHAAPKFIKDYCDPFFHQDWKLFVPPPSKNYRLFVEIPNEGRVDILNEALLAHQSNRLAGHGYALLSLVNYVHYFEKNTASKGGRIQEDLYFNMILFSSLHYVELTRHITLLHPALQLLVEDTQGKPARLYYN
jgi:hypothetical protein